jgi:ElaB/YqjD/DUF883 family membrane-anchored ribosome-binding protein
MGMRSSQGDPANKRSNDRPIVYLRELPHSLLPRFAAVKMATTSARVSRAHKEIKMETTLSKTAEDGAVFLSNLTEKATAGKMFAEDLMEMGKRKAQRLARRGYAAGEDCLDETRHYIKHHPWQSVGMAVGVGVLLGFFGGFMARRT